MTDQSKTDPSAQSQDAERAKWDELTARIEKAEKESRVKRGFSPKLDDTREAISATRIGADFVAAVMSGGLLGWGVDWALGSKPWGLLFCLFAGFSLGFMNVVRTLSRSGAESEQNKKDDPHGDGLSD